MSLLKIKKNSKWVIYFTLGFVALGLICELVIQVDNSNFDKAVDEFYLNLDAQLQEVSNNSKEKQFFYQQFDSLLNLKQYYEAIEIAQNRIKQFPDEEFFLLHEIGLIHYYYVQDIDSAITYFTKAISLNNNYVQVIANRAMCYLELDSLDLAISDYKTASEMDESYYFLLGVTQEKKGQIKAALESYHMYLDFFPDSEKCLRKIDSLENQ